VRRLPVRDAGSQPARSTICHHCIEDSPALGRCGGKSAASNCSWLRLREHRKDFDRCLIVGNIQSTISLPRRRNSLGVCGNDCFVPGCHVSPFRFASNNHAAESRGWAHRDRTLPWTHSCVKLWMALGCQADDTTESSARSCPQCLLPDADEDVTLRIGSLWESQAAVGGHRFFCAIRAECLPRATSRRVARA